MGSLDLKMKSGVQGVAMEFTGSRMKLQRPFLSMSQRERMCDTCRAERDGIWPRMIEAVNFGLI